MRHTCLARGKFFAISSLPPHFLGFYRRNQILQLLGRASTLVVCRLFHLRPASLCPAAIAYALTACEPYLDLSSRLVLVQYETAARGSETSHDSTIARRGGGRSKMLPLYYLIAAQPKDSRCETSSNIGAILLFVIHSLPISGL